MSLSAEDCIRQMPSPYSCMSASMRHTLVVFFLLLQLSCISVEASTKATVTVGSVVFTDPATHDNQLLRLVSDVRLRLRGENVTLKRRPEQSHCPRPHNYKSKSTQLDISKFDKLLKIEYLKDNKELRSHIPKQLMSRTNDEEIYAVADVQALMSMEQLVDALLPLGLMPAVVPEFKGITVGGSLQGLAAESTSFKYGFVHDAIIGFEALLTDGRVLWCSPHDNSDLFYSLPGSFGSLAVCTRVKILCIKAQPYVTVVCTEHDSQSDCVDYMSSIQDSALKSQALGRIDEGGVVPDFLEGIAYKSNQVVSIAAVFTSADKVEKDSQTGGSSSSDPMQHCNGFGNKWFFNQVRDSVKTARIKLINKGNKGKGTVGGRFVLPLKDYLFRHDQGSFWMASYRIPQPIGSIMGTLLDSTMMFRLATALPWLFPKTSIVLQDFIIPRGNVKDFYQGMQKQLQVWPVWLLPMRNIPSEKSIFASPKGLNGEHLCNVGAYGIPGNKYNFIPDNIKLEDLLFKHNGRKVYYSHAFYPREFFYDKLYDGLKYFSIRNKYCSDGALPEIFDKIITKNGKL